MLEDMQARNLSPLTQRAYAETGARFACHFGRSPARLGPEEIRTYHLADRAQFRRGGPISRLRRGAQASDDPDDLRRRGACGSLKDRYVIPCSSVLSEVVSC